MKVLYHLDQTITDQSKGRDPREKKPFLVFDESDLTQYLSLSSSWILTLDHYQIHLVQPNDIALYAHITDEALKKAMDFHEEHPGWYIKRQSGGMIPVTEDSESLYFNYFETILQAVIFAFTSLETFSNICLPENYSYRDAKGKTIDKVTIERFKSLDFKLEFILTDILHTPDPKQQAWWPTYVQLKEIRDRVIHAKPSMAQERYSMLLQPTIFDIIGCYRKILSFYGSFIKANFQLLLDEFPYGFGFDEMPLKTLSHSDYEQSIERMYNPWRPKDQSV